MKISLTTGEPDGDIILSLADFSLILGPEVHLETCWLHLLLYIKPESSHREKKKKAKSLEPSGVQICKD